jgi:hypothetical protein
MAGHHIAYQLRREGGAGARSFDKRAKPKAIQ